MMVFPMIVPPIEMRNVFFRPILSERAPKIGAPSDWARGKIKMAKRTKKISSDKEIDKEIENLLVKSA